MPNPKVILSNHELYEVKHRKWKKTIFTIEHMTEISSIFNQARQQHLQVTIATVVIL